MKLYLRFSRRATFLDRLISLWSYSEWAHVDGIMPELSWLWDHGIDVPEPQITPDQRVYIPGPITAGTFPLFGALSPGVIRHGQLPKEIKWEIRSLEVTEEQLATIWRQAFKQAGKNYDWLGVIGFGLRQEAWHERNRWFCSELWMAMAERAGIELLNAPSRRISPGDLHMSPLLKYEASGQ